MIDNKYYKKPEQSWWQGRSDGIGWKQMRWWQAVEPILLSEISSGNLQQSFALLGFECDEGVARNKGRVGAAKGPQILRRAFSNLPVHFSTRQKVFDLGNIVCTNKNLEEAQNQLSIAVSEVLKNGGFPVLLGGGHEILYGHYGGVQRNYLDKKIGIINFDAHFDLRSTAETGATSGTGFYQIAEDCKRTKEVFLYLVIGIQESSNTLELFDRAESLDVDYISARDFHFSNLVGIKKRVQAFMDKTDIICLTIDMDAFTSADAPGVSAPSATGIRYDLVFYEILKCIVESKKVVSMDIVELNPDFDIDNRTAKLAASIVFDWVNLVVR